MGKENARGGGGLIFVSQLAKMALVKIWVKGCLNEVGGVLKMTELFVRIKGCGVRGSHLRKVGGRGGVGSLN